MKNPHGIIFGAPMVRRLVAREKTQTRRPVKLPVQPSHRGGWEVSTIGGAGCTDSNGRPVVEQPAIWNKTTGMTLSCPFGTIGDRLYVKEAVEESDGRGIYRADGSPSPIDTWTWKSKKLSPIHMPYGARRLELELVATRIEKLKDLSMSDAIAEGAKRFDGLKDPGPWPASENRWSMESPTSHHQCLGSPQTAFGNLYNKLHGGENWNLKDGSPWDENPLVWVLEFKVLEVWP